MGLNDLALRAIDSLRDAGTMPQVFGTITVSDGISMGTEGMKYSLVSRDVIADSIETVCQAQSVDGVLAIGSCDKNMPGAMIAIARMNVPAIFVYGGTIKPGHYDGRDLTVVSVFEAVGQYSAHRGHMAPEAAAGGAIALVQERDLITIDADARLLQLNVPADELERRRSRWQPPAAQYTRGVLAKYAKLVSSSSLGAVTDGEPAQGNMSQFKAAP